MRSRLDGNIDVRRDSGFRAGADDGTADGRRQAEGGRRPSRSAPALQTPADTANAMAQAERLALQSDLAWVGEYNGAITGEVSERMVNAIKEYQKIRAASRPACSIRRSAPCSPRPRGAGRTASAGRS